MQHATHKARTSLFFEHWSSKGRESFSIDLEVNNTTVIFCRKDRATKEYIGPNDFQGYGHEFEKAYTSETTPNSTGHHRIITYQFGGMRYLVRYETDGYVDDTAATATQSGKINDSDDLASLLSSLSLTLAGSSSAQKSTLEMKTRAAHRRLALTEVASQLWFSQTPKLVRAYHDQGVFQDPIVEDVTDDIEKLEDTHQEQLRKLAALIGRILQN
ncbi:hypothetical protein SBRCBS47491_002740 [Sporothrix bragantina]|uniref:Uncharacterized protein n=1 Tax=Sporothrix bragantina TaxID=671064 RepID=A0ABP0B9P3_9PEZI